VQIARRHLRMFGAGVEQRGRAGKIVERGDELVELDGLMRRDREAAGNAEKEVLRRLDYFAGERIAQKVAVVDGAQAEVFESVGELVVDSVVELARVGLHKLGGGRIHNSLLVRVSDGLREGVQVLAGDLFHDGAQKQPRSERRVLRLLGDKRGRGVDGDGVELAGGGSVIERADGFGRDAHGVDMRQSAGAALDGADDLVDVHRFKRAVALADVHDGGFFARGKTGVEVGEAGLQRGGIRQGGHGSSPWPQRNVRENSGTLSGRKDNATATSPPLGGVSEMFVAGLRTCRPPTGSASQPLLRPVPL